jgi:glycosyltransferase involved in cell wall biosynthesis
VRILIALHDYLPRHSGGAEIHAHQLAIELVRRDHAVSAAYTERDLAAPAGELRRGTLDGVRTLEVVHQREYADVRESYLQEAAAGWFERVLAEARPEVVHFHHLALWGSGALRAARAAGARVLVTLHDYSLLCDAATLLRPDGELCVEGESGACSACLRRHPIHPERLRGLGEAQRAALYGQAARERLVRHRADLALAERLIAPSRFLARLFVRAGLADESRVVVLKAGYPGPLHPPRRRDPRRALRVGFVGGLYEAKGAHVLVEAFHHLAGEPIELDIHGHMDWFPAYVARLRERAAGLPIRFRGPFDPRDVDRVLAELDVLCLPSIWYENQPITIQEAHRNGIPVVATDLGGMAEAVSYGVSGLTFPRGDERTLADRLRSLAHDATLYDRLAAGRPRVPALGEIVDRIEALYRGAQD